MIPPSTYSDLFDQLLQGKLSPVETEELIAFLSSRQVDPAVSELVNEHLQKAHAKEEITPEITAALDARLKIILAQGDKEQTVRRLPFLKTVWTRYAAASIIILIALFSWLWTGKKEHPQLVRSGKPIIQKNDVAPGRQGAILTLGDGSKIVLDSLANGVVATQNGSKILLNNGQLAYKNDAEANAAITYNTMTTPRGRQFQLLLPDGTKAWLDAASSLRYPTAFIGKERNVEVTGEVYFEVAKNAAMPFKVKIKDNPTEVEVLGTHFNINAYPNEATVNTTLLEGSVRITDGNEKAMLKPGQQAQVAMIYSPKKTIKILNDVNVKKITAWKDGVFDFEDATLEDVARQLERWYDIQVVFEKNIPKIEFIGKIGRDLTLADVLKGLKMSEVHFRIEDNKRLIVTP